MSESTFMTKERYNYLMAGVLVVLTEEELKQGWHFCNDWDGLLINRDSKEMEACCCNFNEDDI